MTIDIAVEACLTQDSTSRYDVTRAHVESFLRHIGISRVLQRTLTADDFRDAPFLIENVEFIQVCELRGM